MNASPMNHAPYRQPSSALLVVAVTCAVISIVLLLIGAGMATSKGVRDEFWLLMGAEFLLGIIASICAFIHAARSRGGHSTAGLLLGLGGLLLGFGGPVALFLLGLASALGSGGAWGRPLRVRGRVLHPGLVDGCDWTLGDRPDVRDLDDATRAALEALWLHDAQKEHASVPAFARITWMLCAVGAPADLVSWSQRATAEEIDHTRRCFALATGYGGRSHTAMAMPELLVGGLDVKGDALVHLATESLRDGCLLEDFNADVAAECALVCGDPVTRDVLERIAREERSHAELSWALVAWLVERGGADVSRAIARESAALHRVARPSAVAHDKLAIVARADAAKMRAHGRIADEEWAALWSVRVERTRERSRAIVAPSRAWVPEGSRARASC